MRRHVALGGDRPDSLRARFVVGASRSVHADRLCARIVGASRSVHASRVVAGGGRAGAGAHTPLIGVIRRKEGSRQLTYNGHPLYYYVGDRAPGDILCQDVEEYGGHWWVVSPAGGPVTGSGTPCGRSR